MEKHIFQIYNYNLINKYDSNTATLGQGINFIWVRVGLKCEGIEYFGKYLF